jgi:hypothetical protein
VYILISEKCHPKEHMDIFPVTTTCEHNVGNMKAIYRRYLRSGTWQDHPHATCQMASALLYHQIPPLTEYHWSINTTINRLVNTKQYIRCSIRHLLSLFHHKIATYTSVPSGKTIKSTLQSYHTANTSLQFSPITPRTL